MQIIGVTSCLRKNIRIDIPIIIGTSPIREKIDAQSAKKNLNTVSNRNGASTSFATDGNRFGILFI